MRAPPLVAVALTALLASLGGCGSETPKTGGPGGTGASAQPGSSDATAKGLETLLRAILASPDKRAELSATLRPTKADLDAIFDAELAAAAEATYGPVWDKGELVLDPGDPERTDAFVRSGSAEDIAAWQGAPAEEFPGGWKDVGAHLEPGTTFWIGSFVKPGEESGMRFDGFVHVNGQWRIVPKPWRLLRK